MQVSKTTITYTFEKGLDQKVDEKISQSPTILQNSIFVKKGEIQKRYGYNQLSQRTIDGYTISTGAALGSFNNELLLFGNQNVYSYAAANDSWVTKGSAVSVSVTQSEVIRNNYQQTNSDNAVTSGIRLVAWEDSRGGIRASLFDDQSGLALQTDVELSSTGSNVKTLACGALLFVYYIEGTTLYSRYIDSANPTTFSAPSTLRTDLGSLVYDAHTFSSNMLVAYQNNINEITVMYVTQNMVVGNPLVGLPNPVSYSGIADCLSIRIYNGTYISVIHQSVADAGVYCSVLYTNLTVKSGPTLLDNSAAAQASCLNITQIEEVDDSTDIIVYYTSNASISKDISIEQVLYNVATDTVGSASTFIRGNSIMSKPYLHDSRVFLPTAFDSPEQSTYFVIRDDLFIIAKIAALQGGGTRTNCLLAEVAQVTDQLYTLSILIKGALLSQSGSVYTLTGVASILIDHNDQDIFSAEQLGQNTLIAGGYLKMYDGESVVEQGFHLYPELIDYTTGTDGYMSDGSYLFRVTYEWIDAKGQPHISAPSSPIAVTLSGGGSNQSVTFTVPTLKLTQKTGDRVPPIIGLYGTVNGGTVYYKVSDPQNPVFNDVDVDSVQVTATLADADIISNQLLYTNGGVLENISPPACTILQVYKNRLFLGGLENPNQVWYSNEQIVGKGLSFSDFLTIDVDTTGGRITSFSVLDDKLVIFKEEAIFILAGNGPNATGGQNDYTAPQLVNSDCGCVDSNSTVIFPNGVLFKSSKGIYMIDRSLQVSYIGSPVENYNSSTVIRSTLVTSRNEVRFLLSSDILLVYNYLFNQWSVFTNYTDGTDALIYQSNYTYLTNEGIVRQEDPTSYFDNTSPVSMKIVTPWFSFNQLQGYQRIYRVYLIGKFKSQHYLRVKFGYDYKPYFFEATTIDTREFFETQGYGEDPYGDGYYGEGESVYQFQFDVEDQLCQSIRLSIEDLYLSGSGQGFTLTGLLFEVGAKRGGNKLSASKKFQG